MTAVASRDLLTYEQFLELPEDQLRHAELLDGVVVVSPPTLLHQLLVHNLQRALIRWTRGDGGLVTQDPFVRITDRRGYQPDLAWWPAERTSPPEEPPAVQGPPDLAVEVLSPTTRMRDLLRKPRDYAAVGVRELWLLDPDGPTGAILRADGGATLEPVADLDAAGVLGSPLLPGFAVGLAELLRR